MFINFVNATFHWQLVELPYCLDPRFQSEYLGFSGLCFIRVPYFLDIVQLYVFQRCLKCEDW